MLPAVTVIGLAAYRIARVIAHDKIGQPIRDRTYALQGHWPKVGGWVNALTTCPYCLGVHASVFGVLWYAWLVAPKSPEPGRYC